MKLRNCLIAALVLGASTFAYSDESIGFFYQNNGTAFSYNTTTNSNHRSSANHKKMYRQSHYGPKYGYRMSPRHPHFIDRGPHHEYRHGPWCEYD